MPTFVCIEFGVREEYHVNNVIINDNRTIVVYTTRPKTCPPLHDTLFAYGVSS